MSSHSDRGKSPESGEWSNAKFLIELSTRLTGNPLFAAVKIDGKFLSHGVRVPRVLFQRHEGEVVFYLNLPAQDVGRIIRESVDKDTLTRFSDVELGIAAFRVLFAAPKSRLRESFSSFSEGTSAPLVGIVGMRKGALHSVLSRFDENCFLRIRAAASEADHEVTRWQTIVRALNLPIYALRTYGHQEVTGELRLDFPEVGLPEIEAAIDYEEGIKELLDRAQSVPEPTIVSEKDEWHLPRHLVSDNDQQVSRLPRMLVEEGVAEQIMVSAPSRMPLLQDKRTHLRMLLLVNPEWIRTQRALGVADPIESIRLELEEVSMYTKVHANKVLSQWLTIHCRELPQALNVGASTAGRAINGAITHGLLFDFAFESSMQELPNLARERSHVQGHLFSILNQPGYRGLFLISFRGA